MHGSGQRDKDVPDGVGEGDDAVRLEEEHAQAVEEAPEGQLQEALRVGLVGHTHTDLRHRNLCQCVTASMDHDLKLENH